MFSTKHHTISQLPKKTIIDTIYKVEGKKQLGPGVYPVNNLIKGNEITTRDKTGVYHGLAKTSVSQLQFIDDARARAKRSPQVGTYKLNHVSFFY